MSNNIVFSDILKSARETLFEELSRYPIQCYNQDRVINNDCCFRAIIEFEKCIGELIVEEADFAPYRFVSFNILSSIAEDITQIFCWYDSEDDSIETITQKIREGLLIAFNY